MSLPILTLTPNPSLDISGTVDQLTLNEKSYVYDERRQPGGNGINAAVVAKNLGANVVVTGFLGGDTGREISDLLKKIKLPQDFVVIKNRTRSNVTVSQAQTHLQTRLSFSGPKIAKSEVAVLIKKIKEKQISHLVIGGSLPPGMSSNDLGRIVMLGHKMDVPVIVDVPGDILVKVVSAMPFFIKPNLLEFQALIGKKITSRDEIITEALKVNRSVPVVCISSVEGGALLVTKDKIVFGKIEEVKVRSTVGAGDSMVGAITYFMHKQKNGCESRELDLEEMMRWGLAASAATLSNTGLQIGNKKDTHHYLNKIHIERIR